jgi:hypothetical protein
VDRPPVVTVNPTYTVDENQTLSFGVKATDDDRDSIRALSANLGAVTSATFTAVGADSGTFTWTPTYDEGREAPYPVSFTAQNALTGTAIAAITVANVDRAPVVTVEPVAAVNENATLVLGVSASDPDSQAIASLSAAGVPSGATWVEAAEHRTGTLTFTPAVGQGRTAPYVITFSAANALTASSSTAVTVTATDTGAVTAPAYVGRVASDTTATASTSMVLSAGRAVHAGDALLVALMLRSTTTGTVTMSDAAGNAYTLDRDQSDGGAGDRVVVLSARNVKALAPGATLTVTYPRTAACHVSVDEVARIAAPDRSASASDTGTSFDSGTTLPTTQASELLFAVVGNPSGAVPTWAPGWTPLPTLSIGTDRLTAAYRVVSASAAYAATGSISGTWLAGIVTYSTGSSPAPSGDGGALAFETRVIPCPVDGAGVLEFTTTRPGRVRVDVYDVGGRRTRPPLEFAFLPAGHHEVVLVRRESPRGVNAGIYFYRVQAAEGVRNGRFVVIE